jgi:LemA protein
MAWLTWVLIGVVALILLSTVLLYNGLVTRRQRVREAWSDIDVQLKRRHDLVPNLVETVKGYAAHEKGVFEAVTQARAAAVGAGAAGPQERGRAEAGLSGALRSLFAVAERYPELKAVEQFNQLSANLTETENKLEYARGFYNVQVRDYNNAVQTFPAVMLANAFGFQPAEFFQVADSGERAAPKVAFGG